ncbi:MAG: helix-turn-helix domain-containing protein [Halodesulfurarchaeum sp.]
MSDQGEGAEPENERRNESNGDFRDRVEEWVDRARSEFDEGVVDLLSWLLETETRSRVYVHLRQHDWSTGEAVAEGVGLHPGRVRETLDELVERDAVERRGHDGEGTEYEYRAVPPSDLLGGVVEPVRDGLESAVREEKDEQSARIDIDSGTSVEAEAGEADAEIETDLEGEAELDEEGASVAGKGGGDLDVETSDGETEIEGSVDAEVGTDGVDVDVDTDVETADDDEEPSEDEEGVAESDEGPKGSDGSDDETN